MNNVLIEINTKTLEVKRYEKGVCTHTIKYESLPITMDDINSFRDNPDSFIDNDAI